MKQFIQSLGMALVAIFTIFGLFFTLDITNNIFHGISGTCTGNTEEGCEYFFCPYYGPREGQAPSYWKFKDKDKQEKLTDEAFSVPKCVK